MHQLCTHEGCFAESTKFDEIAACSTKLRYLIITDFYGTQE